MTDPHELREPRRVLVLADGAKPAVGSRLGEIEAWLRERVADVRVEAVLRDAEGGGGWPLPDLVVVLGGDGSVLTAVRRFAEEPVPVVGVNFGHVGFLAAIDAARWREGLEEVLAGRALVEPRMLLEARLGASRSVAMNDVVLSRGASQSLVTLRLFVGDEIVSDYRADGLVFATPSGSTAYSLAAGGPILAPDMSGIAVTPIAAHALANRPLVLHPESRLRVRVMSAPGEATLAVDGRIAQPMREGDEVDLARHPKSYPLLAPAGLDPWRRLRERLGWRGSFAGGEES